MRFIIVGLFLFMMSSFVSLSQTQDEINKLFEEGRYTEAVEMVKKKDSIATKKIIMTKKSIVLSDDAKYYYKHKQYNKAKSLAELSLALDENNNNAHNLHRNCAQAIAIYGKDKWYNRFTIGIKGGADLLATNFSFHIGATLKYGFYRDLVNVTLGAEYHHHFTYSNKYDFNKKGIDVLGSQVAFPLSVKFNLFEMSSNSMFYLGGGFEYGLRLTTRAKYDGKYYPSNSEAMNSSTIAGLIHAGIAMRHFDVGIYYKGYFDDIIVPPYFNYMENSRIGVNVAYYF